MRRLDYSIAALRRKYRAPHAVRAQGGMLEIANRWNCWRLKSETAREHLFRLQVHLQCIAVSVEDDLILLDEFDRATTRTTEEVVRDIHRARGGDEL